MRLEPKTLCQIEFCSTDPQATLSFLSRIFGWKAVPITLHGSIVLEVAQDQAFGMHITERNQDSPARESPILPYFRIKERIEDWLEKMRSEGAEVLEEPTLRTAYGKTVKVLIPGGIVLGLFEPSPSLRDL